MSKKDESFENFELIYHHDSEKAVLFSTPETPKAKFWLPKSQITIFDKSTVPGEASLEIVDPEDYRKDARYRVQLPSWLAEKNGME